MSACTQNSRSRGACRTFELVVAPVLLLPLLFRTSAHALRITTPFTGLEVMRALASLVLLLTQTVASEPRSGLETVTFTVEVLLAPRLSATTTTTLPVVDCPSGRMVCQ